MVTEVRDAAWTPALLQPYVDVALEAFGPSRLLFGTDWPVCRLRCEYGEWVEAVRGFVAPLSAAEQAAILGGNAARVYGL
jgi:L-fuconolactonase